MKQNNTYRRAARLNAFALAIGFIFLHSGEVLAHCDRLDGPVVQAARNALDTGNVNLVLIWVAEKEETTIREAFQTTQVVRKLSPEAKEFADLYFFETVVRVHRAGEGEPYTGLKSSGTDVGAGVVAADKALETGSVESLKELLTETMLRGLEERFHRVVAKKNFDPDNVHAGREFVESYVSFIHYAKGLYESAAGQAFAAHAAESGHEE